MDKFNLILASSSPRRLELLKLFQVNFDVISPNVDEKIDKKLKPIELCENIAKLKAENVLEKIITTNNNSIIIAADTLVFYKKKILEKPKDFKDSEKMLKMLSGKTHLVITGLCFCIKENKSIRYVKTHNISKVKFHKISKDMLKFYVSTGEGLDKAGSYGAQGLAQSFIKAIYGSYSNVVGLPLDNVVKIFEGIAKKKGIVWKDLF